MTDRPSYAGRDRATDDGVDARVTTEPVEQRRRRESKRTLFDNVADLYSASRPTYPAEIVSALLRTARVGIGSSVLEIGCGSGQLTCRLAGKGVRVIAIDLAPAMIRAARIRLQGVGITFAASAFEDYDGTDPLTVIVAANAFHWIDPTIGWSKAARLLQPEGWLALLETQEKYEHPLRSSLRDLWIACNGANTEWESHTPWADMFRQSELFGSPVEIGHEERLQLPSETVMTLERTRATFLSYGPDQQHEFSVRLARMLEPTPVVDVVQETHLTMAPVIATTA